MSNNAASCGPLDYNNRCFEKRYAMRGLAKEEERESGEEQSKQAEDRKTAGIRAQSTPRFCIPKTDTFAEDMRNNSGKWFVKYIVLV